MTTLHVPVNLPDASRRQSVTLWNLSDIQWGNRLVDKPLLRRHIKQIAADPKSLVILGGDTLDAVVMGDKRFTAAVLDPDIYDKPAKHDTILSQAINTVVSELTPIKKKIIGAGDGNHELAGNKRTQTSITKEICEKLGVYYIGYECALILSIRSDHVTRQYVVRWHHGSGGGGTKGGKLNRRITKGNAWEGVDVHMSGHVHDPVTGDPIRLVPSWNRKTKEIEILERPVLHIVSGSYLKTRSVEKAQLPGGDAPFTAYSEAAEYDPVHLGMRGVVLMHRDQKAFEVKPELYFRDENIDNRGVVHG